MFNVPFSKIFLRVNEIIEKSAAGAELSPEEIALLLRSGVLITGCCHAGIVNTAEFCRKACPGVRIHTILGGLHLKHADAARLGRTADYLNSLGLKRLVPMHCTGADAVRFLRERLTCEVAMLPVGRKMRLD